MPETRSASNMSRSRELTILIKRREDVFALASAIAKNAQRVTAQNADLFQSQLDHLGRLEKEFEEIQRDIIKHNTSLTDSEASVDTTNVALSFYELIWTARATVAAASPPEKEVSEKAVPPIPSVTSSLPLAPMQIPPFDGTSSAWIGFKALYDQLIHENASLSPVQKFYYLKTVLRGEAAKLIANLDVTMENYAIAYSSLIRRYASKRRLAHRFMSEILNFSSSKRESEYLSVHENAVAGLKAMQLPDLADYVLFRNCYENLSPRMKYMFDDKCDSQRVPTCQELFDFVLHHTQNSELRLDSQGASRTSSKYDKLPTSSYKGTPPKSFLTRKETHTAPSNTKSVSKSKIVCPLCKEGHLIYSCSDFLKLSIADRQATIKRLERCRNCLGQHDFKQCASKKTCNKCGQQHHSFLHSEPISSSTTQSAEKLDPAPRCHFLNAQTSSVVILGTFLAQIQDVRGTYHQIRCVMDPGSHISAVTDHLVRKLGLKTKGVECSVSGLANSSAHATEMLSVSLRSCLPPQTVFKFPVYVFPKICQELPSQAILPRSDLTHLQGLPLADPYYDQPSPVDLLLSAEMSAAILSSQQPNLIVGQPTAIRTMFGWILYGSIPVATPLSTEDPQSLFTLQETLRNFWEVEEVPVPRYSSLEEEFCEAHFIKTHSRDETGRYIVSLPFRPDRPAMGTNRESAMKRWLNLEKKLATSPERKSTYDAVLQEYLDKNHMEPASTSTNYILPHHAVTKLSSTTKLRVVFDASAQDSLGLSLNDRLWIGPKLQRDITAIISSFRSFRFALCGDISQMYRMIWLHPSDRRHQHIFWRRTPSFEVSEFELRTLTFGLAPSPFLAQRVLRQLILDEGKTYDLASYALEHHTYIDDVITGCNSLEEGRLLQRQLQELLEKGGFHLRKWCSNAPELLREVPPEDLETPLEFVDGSHGLKVLGLFWNPHRDIFTYQVHAFSGKITKRTILSFVARIYDPMGWLAPVTIVAKCFLQKLWLLKLDWDMDLPLALQQQWSQFSSQFPHLCSIQLPRNISQNWDSMPGQYKIIGFCDASELAYAACVYLQDVNTKSLRLLQAKTKVAPLKSRTIPCLELFGALLLIRLVSSMSFPVANPKIAYFTDSQIVLTWLLTPLHRLKPLVANRVAQILDHSSVSHWHHISGARNPADIASRGLQPEELLQSTLWWNGPTNNLLEEKVIPLPLDAIPELKTNRDGFSFLATNATQEAIIFFEKFSSWLRLQRIMAWILRFNSYCRSPNTRQPEKWLTVEEQRKATQRIIYLTQKYYFSAEIHALKSGHLPRSLSSLHPFLDSSECLRVGGRLQHSHLAFFSKHPILLPKDSHITELIIRHYHTGSLHSGPSTVQALIQRKYWIPSLRNLVKKHIFQCVQCHRLRASTTQPRMGNLPEERVTIARPFSRTATDFAGPFYMKESLRRNARQTKCYLCIFVCLTVKAVHLEVVTSLTTDAFLAAFVRFTSRRGLPAIILSDNGRNFVGASRTLKELQTWLQLNADEIGSSLAAREIQWRFNPPEAPHFGGLFEAAIKSAKTLLYRLVGNQSFTFEELTTLFLRIEAILNSRPLTRLSSDPSEDYLAPSHFLIGGMLHEIPEQPLAEEPAVSRWKRVQQLGQAFWKKWSTQYLQQLLPRTRWQKDQPPIQVDTMVWIKGQSTSPLTWPLGRVTDVFPGPDGIVRVATVKTASGSYVRPVVKLIPLPMSE